MTTWITKNLGISPCSEKLQTDVHRLDARDLVDRKGNHLEVLREKIQTGTGALKSGKRLVVCCDLGVSRSAALAVGILTELGHSFDASVGLVARKVKDQSMNLDLLEDVRESLQHTKATKAKSSQVSRILILGSTGFIGRALTSGLADDYDLFCPTSSQIDLTKDVMKLYTEIREKQVDLIVDLAHPRPRNSVDSLAKSVAMIRNVLEASRACERPLIFCSSLFVYDGYHGKALAPAGSDLKSAPASIYGQSKALCEEYIRWYRDSYGLTVTILRPTHVYGRDMDRFTFLWKFIANATASKPIVVHRYQNGFQKFDLLHINDLTEALKSAVDLHPQADVNLGTGKEISALDVAKQVLKATKSKSELRIVNVKDYVVSMVADTSKSRELLKWQAKTSFDQGLRSLLNPRE